MGALLCAGGWPPRPLCSPRAGALDCGVGRCARMPARPDTAATARRPGPPPALAHTRLRSARDSSASVGSLASPYTSSLPALPDPGPRPQAHGRGPPALPALPLLSEPRLALPPVLELRAHAVGATQARIDIFREREIFLRRSPRLAVL